MLVSPLLLCVTSYPLDINLNIFLMMLFIGSVIQICLSYFLVHLLNDFACSHFYSLNICICVVFTFQLYTGENLHRNRDYLVHFWILGFSLVFGMQLLLRKFTLEQNNFIWLIFKLLLITVPNNTFRIYYWTRKHIPICIYQRVYMCTKANTI